MPANYNELKFAVIKNLKYEAPGQLKAVTGLAKML